MVAISAVWGWAYDLPGPILLCVLLGVAAFGASLINATQEWWQGTETTLQGFLTPGKILIGLILIFFFADSFLKEDRKTRRELEGEIVATEEHIGFLVGMLPPPILPIEQQRRLKEALQQRGPFHVNITYLDSTDSRPGAFAGHLREIFRAASWKKVDLHRATWSRRNYERTHIKVDAYDDLAPPQQAVIEAFREAGVPLGHTTGEDIGDRIELIVGVM